MQLDQYLTVDPELQKIFENERIVDDSELCVIRLERHLKTVLRRKELLRKRGGNRHTLRELEDINHSLVRRVVMARNLYLNSRSALDDLFLRYYTRLMSRAPL